MRHPLPPGPALANSAGPLVGRPGCKSRRPPLAHPQEDRVGRFRRWVLALRRMFPDPSKLRKRCCGWCAKHAEMEGLGMADEQNQGALTDPKLQARLDEAKVS